MPLAIHRGPSILIGEERLPLTSSPIDGAANMKGWVAIATRASKAGRGKAPVQIQAQFLRERQAYTPAGPRSGFAIIPEDDALRPVEIVTHGAGPWQEDDVERAISAAEEAGLSDYRVEIAPDGTISIIVGAPSASGTDPSAG